MIFMKILLWISIISLYLWPANTIGSEGKIAYTKIHNGFWQIWEMEIGSSQAKLLTDTPVDKSYLDWSADGKRIAYVTSKGELWIMDVEDKKSFKVPLNIPALEPKWSKDGKRILFMSPKDTFHDDTDIWSVNIDGKNLTKITKQPWVQSNPSWLPDEEEILFVDNPEIMGDEICKINIKNGDIIRLTQNKFNDIQPSYVPGEDKIVYAANKNGDYDIWIMDKFGQNPKNLTESPSHDIIPRPTQDGCKIYFLSDRTGYFQIFAIDLKTGQLKQITHDKIDKKDFAVYAK